MYEEIRYVHVNLFQKYLSLHQLTHNMSRTLSYCGLIDAKIRASDKDLPVHTVFPHIVSAEIILF